MEHPTCKTCPYWELTFVDPVGGDRGDCRKALPRAASEVYGTGELLCDYEPYEGVWVDTRSDQWCGEHPDFLAWIQERRRGIPPVVAPDDTIHLEETPTSVRKAFHRLGVVAWSQAANLTEAELVARKGIGPVALAYVMNALQARGLELRRAPDDATRQVADAKNMSR